MAKSEVRNGKPSNNADAQAPTFVEFFAGIGLVRLGLEQAGWQCVFANDIDADKQVGYELNFSSAHFHLGDIWNLQSRNIPKGVTLLTSSFPCTDLSLAGYRKGLEGSESSAFWGVIRILKELKSNNRTLPLLMFENVVGFLTSHRGADFRAAIEALNALGYYVDAFILDALLFVPQSRPRLFLIAVHERHRENSKLVLNDSSIMGGWDNAMSSPFSSVARPEKLRSFIYTHPNLKWALFDAPDLPAKRSVTLNDIIEDVPAADPSWWSEDRVKKLLGQMSAVNLEKIRQLRSRNAVGYATAYRRMRQGRSMAEVRVDGIAGCLRTPKGGSSRQILIEVNGEVTRARLLNGREYARLQGVPDSFSIHPDSVKAAFGFGDAVCVPAITWIGKHLLNPLVKATTQRVRARKSA
jgi:DNA (cytosine-5)-methyltransferase 1